MEWSSMKRMKCWGIKRSLLSWKSGEDSEGSDKERWLEKRGVQKIRYDTIEEINVDSKAEYTA